MEFRKTDYKLKTKDGNDIVGEARINGIRYFKLSTGEVKPSFETPHYCEVEEELPVKKVSKLEELESRIAQLENTLDNKLEKDKV